MLDIKMSWYLFLAGSFTCLLMLYQKVKTTPNHPKEPPIVGQKIPYIGHLIGVIFQGSRYYTKISHDFQFPIYTLPVPGNRIYIVNSPKLVAAVDRNSKAISFAPYIVQFAKRILVPTPEGLEALAKDADSDEALCCRNDTLKAMHSAMSPGTDLDLTTLAFFESMKKLLAWEDQAAHKTKDISLFAWTRKIVTKASTDAIFGASENPFQDPKVEAGFWAIDEDFALLGLNQYPALLAPKGNRGRQTFFHAFKEYYASEGYKTGSRVVQSRYKVHQNYGVSLQDIEHFDLGLCYPLLINTAPATAWAIYYIYSQQTLLAELRTTFETFIQSTTRPDGLPHEVDVGELIASCPLLQSIIQETLRIQSRNAGGRVVREDTWIEDEYFLKKDSFLLIPSTELHNNENIWGPSFSTFNPRRFLQHKSGQKGTRYPASANRIFGSGASVCPGRHLAMKEIMIVLIITILKYELSPRDNGPWRMPKSRPPMITSIPTPSVDLDLKIRPRTDAKSGKWRFTWKELERQKSA